MPGKPDYIRTDEMGSFARHTITKRLPLIIQSVIDNNNFDNATSDKLESLLRDLPEAELRPLTGDSDVNRTINAEIQTNKYRWNNAPFIFAENYLYHRLRDIAGYPHKRRDYFAFKKNSDVLAKQDTLLNAIDDYDTILNREVSGQLKPVLYSYLIGNTADLRQEKTLSKNTMTLLIDDSERLRKVFDDLNQIDIVLDNSGEELLQDILFSYWALHSAKAAKVNLHFKTFPYFVSDAMKSDFFFLMETLSGSERGKRFSSAINAYIAEGKLVLHEDPFWTDANDFLAPPERIQGIFSGSGLVVFKGDLNYRKLVEDRHWSYDTPTKDLIPRIRNNCLIIRVLKSELITGLDTVPDASGREWMINGKYGIIQLIRRPAL